MSKITFKKIVGLVLGIVGLVGVSHSAFALTISPVRLELAGDPGKTVTQQTTLINETPNDETFYSSYANFESQGETGTPSFVDAKEDLGTWMTAPEMVFLPAGQSKIVPITISIPKNAEAGGHFAAVFWGTTPPKQKEGLGVGAKTGVLILLRVNGDVTEEGGILDFGTTNSEKVFTALPVNFTYRFQNNGGDRIKPTGDVVIKNMLSLTSAKVPGNPVEGNILPGSTRKFETAWQGGSGPKPLDPADAGNFFNKVSYEWRNFAFGHYSATMTLAYGTKNQVSTGHVGFWVLPWHLTIFVLVLLIVIYFLGRKFVGRYNAWVIKMAKESIRKEGGSN